MKFLVCFTIFLASWTFSLVESSHTQERSLRSVLDPVRGDPSARRKVILSNPCSVKFCGTDGICKVVNEKAVCVSKGPECSLPKVVGPCEAIFLRFYYNMVTRKCEEFAYGGCRGNENNFETKEFCESTCKSEDVCSLPAVQGPCEAHIERYFYNSNTSRCEKFYYGGCQGNKNNFKTIQECESNCSRSVNPCSTVKCKADTECVVKYGKAFCRPVLVDPCKRLRCGTGAKCVVKFGKPFCLLVNPCATVKCKFGRKCVLTLGKPSCRPVLANPCIATLCLVGSKCVVVNGEGKCIPITKPTVHPLCAAISCLKGTKCVLKNGRATCATPCSSSRDCKQQGSFCKRLSGVCECKRFCWTRYEPVCGSDGRRYHNRCKLDASACKNKTTITIVKCQAKVY